MIDIDKLTGRLNESKLLSTQDPNKSFEIAEDVLTIAKAEKLDQLIGQAYFHMAYACRVMSKYNTALENAFQAIQIFKNSNNKEGLVKTSNIIGIIYFYYGDYTSSNRYYMKALDVLETIDEPLIKSSVLNNIGELHRLSGQGDKANQFYFRALDITIKNQFKNNASVIYANIGEVYYTGADYENSLKYLKEGFKLAKEEKNFLALGEIESKLGFVMYSIKNYAKASEYYALAFEHLNFVNNKFYLIDVLINISILEEAEGKGSLTYLNEALDIAMRLELHPKTSRILKLMGDYYEEKNDYKEALNCFKAHFLKEKEIEASNLATRLSIMSLEFKYDKDKKESQIMRELNDKFKKEIDKSHGELESIKVEYQKLLNENIIDELTQIYNRKGIRQLLVEKTQNLKDKQYAVYIVDIDYFKKYNDSQGHIQGDVCLRIIADKLKGLKFEDYFIGRFGGEEFLAYAKVNNLQEAKEIAEIIRRSISELDLTYTVNDKIKKVTVSVGGKVSDHMNHDMNVLIRGADDALYQAKNQGRNQIVVF